MSLLQLLSASLEYEQTRTRYWAEGERVVMAGLGGPIYLDHADCDQILGIYLKARAKRDFNALADALVRAGGIDWGASPDPAPTTCRGASVASLPRNSNAS